MHDTPLKESPRALWDLSAGRVFHFCSNHGVNQLQGFVMHILATTDLLTDILQHTILDPPNARNCALV